MASGSQFAGKPFLACGPAAVREAHEQPEITRQQAQETARPKEKGEFIPAWHGHY
jgi:hypothetical protein